MFITYSINFCVDLERFVGSLRRVVRSGGHVYVAFVPPTLGCCLRWQYDEYTFNILYQPATLKDAFARHGFDPVAEWEDRRYHYLAERHWTFKVMDFLLPYAWAAKRRACLIDRRMIQRNFVQLFRAGA